ncbi:MAG: NUDIX hydrolase [Wujia sp.]
MDKFNRKKQELVYDGKIVAVYKDYLETPDGESVIFDYLKHKHGGGSSVLLVDQDECTYLIRQYRNSIDDISIEIPAGGYNFPGESGETCARREAEEETGLIPNRMYHVSNVVSSIGTYDERTDIFIGTDLKTGTVHYDPNEFIDVLRIPVDEAMDMVYDGRISDSKTVVALFAYYHMKQKGIISI